ncbi:MAG: metallophosphoesterase family protein, partial [Gemmatimonadota bacterium]|nr:metallophosphoesterase family protein [Gemmatimonadota bacterium]
MDNIGRIAIFSDVHGNLEALQTVLEKIAEAQVDRIICLGDMVGYGAD